MDIPPGEHDRGANSPTTEARGYYGLPVLKKPIWRWEIWSYFFLGGIAAGSFVVASLAVIFGDQRDRPIVRSGYVISALALVLCPPLLIKDLGRPARFLNMLRIIKPESPMSLGIWGLLGFSACVFPMALKQGFEGNRTIVGRVARRIPENVVAAAGSVLACFVGGYTGVLLSTTSVPLWSRSRFLGPVFLASAFSASISAIALVLAFVREAPAKSLAKLHRLEQVVLVAETVATVGYVFETSWAARPLIDPKKQARSFLIGAVGLGIIVPLSLSLRALPRSRRTEVLVSIVTVVGGVFLRYAIVAAGRASAEDPEATFRHAGDSEAG